MHIRSMTNEELGKQINIAFDLLITDLDSDAVISEDQKDKIVKYKAVCYETGFWGNIMSKLFKEEKDSSYIKIVKL